MKLHHCVTLSFLAILLSSCSRSSDGNRNDLPNKRVALGITINFADSNLAVFNPNEVGRSDSFQLTFNEENNLFTIISISKQGEQYDLNKNAVTIHRPDSDVITIQWMMSIPSVQEPTVVNIFSYKPDSGYSGKGVFMAYDKDRALAFGTIEVKGNYN